MNLTNEEIRIKIAESLGARLWNNPTPSGPSQLWGFQAPSPEAVLDKLWLCGEADCLLPDYPESLDACAEFEKTLTWREHLTFRKHLWDLVITLGPEDTWDRLFTSADAKTRCLAYLKTKGLIP